VDKCVFGFRWLNKPSWATMCTIHFLKSIFSSKLWNISSSFFTGFERFKQPRVCFLVGYILSSDHNWKGGILSEIGVTETLCSVTGLFTLSFLFVILHLAIPNCTTSPPIGMARNYQEIISLPVRLQSS
jgi:hypothetical protein